ncbi:PREDICTED: nuclear protein MDM1 isoform X3 [Gavialis gangeticus]|uniref:nuclear protein MDM1 isoform X3 n=1 Tax=Gavialis gangeticus TaxID=94835 RepID=UPI00092E7929|nr:PREDICTED: nuclear protein MDM1 isoform X3 [Gavialis gangeticus]
MPVRFKGLSEYKRNFKWKKLGLQESCRPSQEQMSTWAGLRSDQLGIVREPNFISKRKVPYYNPQISKSFEWRGDSNLNDLPEAEVPGPTELHADHNNNDINHDKVEIPDAPRLPKTIRSRSADSRVESAIALAGNTKKKSPPATPVKRNSASVSPKKHLDKVEDGFHRVLQKKAGMNIFPLTSFPRSSEYQSQFIWKTPQELSPILAAERVIHNASKSIPTFKSPAVTPETEYERSFKVSVLPKEQKVRNDLEEEELPICEQINLSPDGKNTRKEMFLKSTEQSSKQGKSETEQKQPKQKNKQHVTQKPFSFYTSLRCPRKMNTEYRSKFLSPAQYVYKDGAWSRIRHNVPNQVKELREKAKSYRQQVHGTHFSRYHLNQILSDNNSLWDVSSNSSSEETISNNIKALDLAGVLEKQRSPNPAILQQPESGKYIQQKNTEKLGMSDASTVPVRRRLVWGEQEKKEQMENQSPAVEEEKGKEKKQETAGAQKLEENDQEVNVENKIEEENASLLNSSADASELSSVSSKKGGRLPTPKLKELGGGQRTHHDLTTPAVGGAVLVSPPKVTSSSPQQRKKEVLETDASPYKQVIREASKRKSSRHEGEVEAVSQLMSPAAGLKTLDPLPLRKDSWPATKASDERASPAPAHAECSITSPVLKSVKEHTSSYWGPSRRIQGTLRDPEFQHNGNVASPKMKRFQLPLQERNYEDEDDRLSQISARSAASSSLASQVLERAQKRKENFWGKT